MWFVKGDQNSKKIVFMDNPRASVASENGQTLISFRPKALISILTSPGLSVSFFKQQAPY